MDKDIAATAAKDVYLVPDEIGRYLINTFSVIPYELVDEAANDSDYASDYDSDIDEEEAIFNRISNYCSYIYKMDWLFQNATFDALLNI